MNIPDEKDRILADIKAMASKVKLMSLLRRIDEASLQGRFKDALVDSLRAIKMDPDSVNTLYYHATILMSLQRFEDAALAYEKVLAIDPKHTDAQYFLAAINRKAVPERAPESYVTALFDGYSGRFDSELIDKLRYNVPADLLATIRLLPDALNNKLDILDLGCGTGLCGAVFADFASTLVGVDLSGRMIAKSRERGIYTELIKSDISAALQQYEGDFDLILAGDVFIYIGNLDRIFPLAVTCLRPGGLLAFSIEVCESDENYLLRTSGRYAQSPEYIQRLADNSGFSVLASNPAVLRYERGQPINGIIFVLGNGAD